MYFQRQNTLLIIMIVIFVTILCHANTHVGATRELKSPPSSSSSSSSSSSEFVSGASESHLATYPSMYYEKAKLAMATWLERLPSGPSPSGPGH
ncbi:hypothetical protein LOK49_LG01G02539 [Camellia lanceoleosa]|uniref:Uncharacterized protein n=1 Tax=Camellia lanceoleosa TaxID=1840588 RepID=A0ACC0IXF5_9ERIC|nr:hypothetical protein LOK49_LG01G02539 [Camellia lanceoleosa]